MTHSNHAEAGTILDSSEQFLAQNVFTGVAGNHQLVKAGVCWRQFLVTNILIVFNNVKLHWFKTIYRCPVTPCRKGEQTTFFLIVPFIEYDLPEPGNKLWFRGISISIDAVFFQLLEVEFPLTTNYLLKVTRSQYLFQHFLVYHTLKPFLEWGYLLRTLPLKLILDEESHKLFPIRLSNRNIFASFNKFNFLHDSKLLKVNSESSTDNLL